MTLQSEPDVLDSVRARYADGATRQVPELCCPVDYDAQLLAVLPEEIVARDYGCGDPSRFVREGDVVLDLGSGGGKICYIASQVAGPKGRVIGVDATDEMLTLARKYTGEVGDKIGWHNVEFRRAHIQDLALDHDVLATWLTENPVRDLTGHEALRAEERRLRSEAPMIQDGSVDLVLSNCVLNLVENSHREQLFREVHRVLARGGRCAISDIVSDEDVPLDMQQDPELWSGCISGAMREDRFLRAFEAAGLHGIEIAEYQTEPWAVVRGIEFRSITVVVAHKGKAGPCMEHGEAVLYKGPWKEVLDDDGHRLRRGERTAVCRKTFELLSREPYSEQVLPIAPLVTISEDEAAPFTCSGVRLREPSETKRGIQREDVAPGASCDPGDSCC